MDVTGEEVKGEGHDTPMNTLDPVVDAQVGDGGPKPIFKSYKYVASCGRFDETILLVLTCRIQLICLFLQEEAQEDEVEVRGLDES